jgi:hypothetical protein
VRLGCDAVCGTTQRHVTRTVYHIPLINRVPLQESYLPNGVARALPAFSMTLEVLSFMMDTQEFAVRGRYLRQSDVNTMENMFCQLAENQGGGGDPMMWWGQGGGNEVVMRGWRGNAITGDQAAVTTSHSGRPHRPHAEWIKERKEGEINKKGYDSDAARSTEW